MTYALIGSSGFVGTTLCSQASFDALFHSRNIHEINGRSFTLVVCAGAPAAKWQANQDPPADRANLQRLMDCLKTVRTEQLVLISTVDVYQTPIEVDEQTPIVTDGLHAYGKHRYALEVFIARHFANYRIIRLPGLFGAGLRKNFLYDMIHSGASPWTHCASVFQFYNLARLWHDLQTVLQSEVPLVNFATEPVAAADVARHSFDVAYDFETASPPVRYDMQTRYAGLFNATGPYLADARATFDQVRAFAAHETSAR